MWLQERTNSARREDKDQYILPSWSENFPSKVIISFRYTEENQAAIVICSNSKWVLQSGSHPCVLGSGTRFKLHVRKKILQHKDDVALEQVPSISEDFYVLVREIHDWSDLVLAVIQLWEEGFFPDVFSTAVTLCWCKTLEVEWGGQKP